jgi:8-oxo-dGTP diphosphatase
MQQRDDIPGILYPGKIGLFGGHREGDETFMECVVREIHEELSYFIPPERFKHLASRTGPDPEVDGGTVRGEFYVAHDVPKERLVITEGSLLVIDPADLALNDRRFTPSARFALSLFLKG